MEEVDIDRITLCPSARLEWVGSIVFGVVGGTVQDARVVYLSKPQSFTDELIEQVSPVTPAEVVRTAACAKSNCQHFDGKNCRLAQRIVEQLPAVVEELLPCSIRRDCRWWQEGKAACMRCPQVITDNYNPSELIREVAAPSAS